MPTILVVSRRIRTRWTAKALCCIMATLLVVACSPVQPASLIDQTVTPVEPTATSPVTAAPSPATPPSEKRIPAYDKPDTGGPARALPFDSPAGLAAYDLAAGLGIAPEAVVVLRIQDMEFPAPGLGCPSAAAEIDASAEAATVLGQEITLAAAGQEYVYHASGWDVELCSPTPEFSDLSLPPQQGVRGAPTQAARAALAEQLGLPVESIEVRSVQAVEWPDASLGCAEPGMMYAQVITPGYLIRLDAGGKVYEVHSDLQRAVVCDRTMQADEP